MFFTAHSGGGSINIIGLSSSNSTSPDAFAS